MRSGNREVGGRVIEFGGAEYMVRGHGYLTRLADLENIVLAPGEQGAPIRIKDVGDGRARTGLSAAARRTSTASGDAVSGIVIMRHGENAFDVIARVKEKLRAIEAALPARRDGGAHLRPLGR